MANELKGIDAHSAEYFGDTRDDWWNRDFIEAVAKRWRFHEMRAVLDVGCSIALGESLPGLFASAGLRNVEVRLNDRASWMVPPYESPAERHRVEETRDMTEREIWIWDELTTRRYFVAGAGSEIDFAALWGSCMEQRRRVVDAIDAKTFVCAGGSLHYLVHGVRASG